MTLDIVHRVCLAEFRALPVSVERNLTGIGSYVYTLEYPSGKYILKMSPDRGVILGSSYWLSRLRDLPLPIPRIVAIDADSNPAYCIMTFIEGKDLGTVYRALTDRQKKEIAERLFECQNVVREMPKADGFGFLRSYGDTENMKPLWANVVRSHISRSERRIIDNGIFSQDYAGRVSSFLPCFVDYFSRVEPRAFFDDTTTKNLMIDDGRVSGIIDLDWLCFGDRLYVIALTTMSLIAMKADVTYVEHWKSLERLSAESEKVLLFYTLVFCLDFMSEKGMRFNRDAIDPVQAEEVAALMALFEELEKKLGSMA
jgi:Phosphotransferase enzyme family